MLDVAALVLFATFAQVAPASPAPAATGPSKAHAQALLREGTALFDRGQHAAALAKFEAAFAVYPSPKILFNIGAADRALGRKVDAAEAFRRFLAEAPDAPAASRNEALQAITELTAVLARIVVKCPDDGAEIFLDEARVGVTPLANPVFGKPGHHEITARFPDGAVEAAPLDVEAGAIGTVTIAPRGPGPAVALVPPSPSSPPSPSPSPSPAPSPSPSQAALNLVPSPPAAAAEVKVAPSPVEGGGADRPLTHRWWFWTAIGVAVVAGTVAVVAARSGGTDVPTTSLGSQRAF